MTKVIYSFFLFLNKFRFREKFIELNVIFIIQILANIFI